MPQVELEQDTSRRRQNRFLVMLLVSAALVSAARDISRIQDLTIGLVGMASSLHQTVRAAVAAPAAPAAPNCPQTLAQSDDSAQPFYWNGRVAPDQLIEISGIRGGIDAKPAVGGEPDVIVVSKIEQAVAPVLVAQRLKEVAICALRPQEYSRRANIGERKNRSVDQPATIGSPTDDVRLNFVVDVPAGVEFVSRTFVDKIFNDEIEATWLASADPLVRVCPSGTPLVDPYSVNGFLNIWTGHAPSKTRARTQAHTLRAEIDAKSADANCADSIELKTARGTIAIDLLQLLKTKLEAETRDSDTVLDHSRTRKILIQRILQTAPVAAEDAH